MHSYKTLLILGGFFSLSAFANVPEETRTGVIVNLTNEVYVIRKGGEKIKAVFGTKVQLGDQIQTGDKSMAKIIFDDNSMFDLNPKSKLIVEEMKLEKKIATSEYKLDYGKVRAVVAKKKSKDRFTVKTNTATMGVRGTEFGIEEGEVICMTGECEITVGNADPVQFENGEKASFDSSGKISTADADKDEYDSKYQKLKSNQVNSNHDQALGKDTGKEEKAEKKDESKGEPKKDNQFQKNLDGFDKGKDKLDEKVLDETADNKIEKEDLSNFADLADSGDTGGGQDIVVNPEFEIEESTSYEPDVDVVQENLGAVYQIKATQVDISPEIK